jgi:hypothetical protein
MDGTGSQTKLGMIQSLNAGERLANATHFQAILMHRADLQSAIIFKTLFFVSEKDEIISSFSQRKNPKWVGCFQPTHGYAIAYLK